MSPEKPKPVHSEAQNTHTNTISTITYLDFQSKNSSRQTLTCTLRFSRWRIRFDSADLFGYSFRSDIHVNEQKLPGGSWWLSCVCEITSTFRMP